MTDDATKRAHEESHTSEECPDTFSWGTCDKRMAIDAAVKAAEERGHDKAYREEFTINVPELLARHVGDKAAAEMRERVAHVVEHWGCLDKNDVDAAFKKLARRIRALPLHKEADDTLKPPVWTKEEIDAARSRVRELDKKIGWGDPDDNDDENPQTRGDT